MIRRPGYISNLGMIPRNKTIKLGSYAEPSSFRLGNFGKGSFVPPPSAPPGSAAGSVALDSAINKSTKQYYMQDPKCPEGENTQTKGVPCVGADCCDGADCDPPGTVYQEEGCYDDPNYMELPPEPSEGFTSCQQRAGQGYPEPCNEQTCPSCFAPKQQQQQQQQQQQPQEGAQAAPPSAEAQAAEDAEAARLSAELQKLETEHSRVEQIVTQTAALPLPSSYTGGGTPVTTRRASSSAPTAEQKIASLVEAHETRKAMQHSSAPPPIARSAAPAPSQPSRMAPPAEDDDDDNGGGRGRGRGVMSWLRGALFGSYEGNQGLGETKSSSILIPIIIVLGLLYFFKMRK